MNYEFKAVLKKLPGKMQWTVFYVPFSVQEIYGTKGRLNVNTKIDGHSFKGTLLPSVDGHYMVYNKKMKGICKKSLGESILVEMEQDTEPRIIKVPDELMIKLNENKETLIKFNKLPEYIKREEINKILDAKRVETRERRIQKLIQSLL